MKVSRSKRVLLAGAVVLLGLFLFRQHVGGAHVVKSISLALGRPVQVSSVHLHLLPRPGFDLENFVVEDDPGFGAEPVLRAEEVSAALRLSSLLHGRLEIARLSLTEPSLNLVHSAGHWNVETLLQRTAQIQVVPTSKLQRTWRPGFPYIEASHARINLKFGAEKMPYALSDAELSLWQDSENTWGLRLRAEPLRSDFNLSDTGIIRVNGEWQRSSVLEDTPLNINVLWERAQLGQLTKLVYGNDKGWRGATTFSATLTGTPADLTVSASAAVADFRHLDVLGGGSLQLATKCSAHYSSRDKQLSGLQCQSPVGNGLVTLDGDVNARTGALAYDLKLTTQGVPMQSVIALARHTSHGLPDDLAALGQIDGKAELRGVQGDSSASIWWGNGEISGIHLTSVATNAELKLNSIPITLSSPRLRQRAPASSGVTLEVGPFHGSLGQPSPVVANGAISKSGYEFHLQGPAQVQKLLQAARLMGIPAVATNAEGVAKVDVAFSGYWDSAAASRAIGKAQLSSVRAQVRGVNAPLQITSANLILTADKVKVQNLLASLDGTTWNGSLTLARPCAVQGTCTIEFNLHADEILGSHLNQLLDPSARPQPWYKVFVPATAGPSYLSSLNATGTITAKRLVIEGVVASEVSANVEVKAAKVHLADLRAQVLGGKHVGDWKADFGMKPPQYVATGTLDRFSLAALATGMNDDWIRGTATADYRLTGTGLTSGDLSTTAAGVISVDASDVSLPHLALEGHAPFEARRWNAHLLLQDGKFEIQNGRLETNTGTYALLGTASLKRALNLTFTRDGGSGFAVTGTVEKPHASELVAPQTSAELKR